MRSRSGVIVTPTERQTLAWILALYESAGPATVDDLFVVVRRRERILLPALYGRIEQLRRKHLVALERRNGRGRVLTLTLLGRQVLSREMSQV